MGYFNWNTYRKLMLKKWWLDTNWLSEAFENKSFCICKSTVACICVAVMCGTPPAVDNAYLVGRRRSHYDIHAVVRYQCDDGFFQRHVPTVRCRPYGTWERPKIICTKCKTCMSLKKKVNSMVYCSIFHVPWAGIIFALSPLTARRSHRYRRQHHRSHREHRRHRRHGSGHRGRD